MREQWGYEYLGFSNYGLLWGGERNCVSFLLNYIQLLFKILYTCLQIQLVASEKIYFLSKIKSSLKSKLSLYLWKFELNNYENDIYKTFNDYFPQWYWQMLVTYWWHYISCNRCPLLTYWHIIIDTLIFSGQTGSL